MTLKRALVTGVTGQDGAYLAQLLLSQGCEVYGAMRRSSSLNDWRLRELGIQDRVKFVGFELLELTNIIAVLKEIKPAAVFNLAAQSFVAESFRQPLYTADVDAIGALRILEAIRAVNPEIRLYQASTSEMFGKTAETPQTETTPLHPRSPYGVAKQFAHWACINYRESYGIHASCGILFNHESPLRGREFVTRKVTSGLALLKAGSGDALVLGNINSCRDWGHARDYVKGMLSMVERDRPDVFVLATGQTHTIRSFVEIAARRLGFDLVWEGEGVRERAIDRLTNRPVVTISEQFYRPAEVDHLLGDAAKAERELGWTPTTPYEQLVTEMVDADLRRIQTGQPLM
jgi:GDPmannose 4,6-dehydratase